jgi:small subunit ribosomal protein S6
MSGNLRTYETVVITKVDMAEETFKTLLGRCKTAITDLGKGEVVMEDDWGLANIAFEIKKEPRGRWTYLRYKSAAAGVDEVLRTLKINEGVLRYMTTKASEDGKDYESLRAQMPKELAERDKPRDWKEDRPRRGGHRPGGFRRDRDDGGGGYQRDRDGGGGGYQRDRGDHHNSHVQHAQSSSAPSHSSNTNTQSGSASVDAPKSEE